MSVLIHHPVFSIPKNSDEWLGRKVRDANTTAKKNNIIFLRLIWVVKWTSNHLAVIMCQAQTYQHTLFCPLRLIKALNKSYRNMSDGFPEYAFAFNAYAERICIKYVIVAVGNDEHIIKYCIRFFLFKLNIAWQGYCSKLNKMYPPYLGLRYIFCIQ